MRRLFLGFAMLFWCGSALGEDPVEFGDETLKAAVEYALWIPDPTPTDMLALTDLTCTNGDVSDLAGLEYATNLDTLDLCWNRIADLSALSGLTALRRLNINNNQIGDISPLSGLSRLQWLNLHMNQISDLSALSGLSHLQTLIVYSNQIGDISALSGLTSLQTLYLFRNQISDASPLSGLSALQDLRLDDNRISDISALSGLGRLQDLNLQRNQVRDISVLSGLSRLQVLNLGNNQIIDLSALSGLDRLQDLNLQANQISDISALSGLTSLKYLWLEDNPLRQRACSITIPQIVANNPGLYLDCLPCAPPTLSISSTAGGSVTGAGEGTFTYEGGEVVRVVAQADPGFVFSNWSGDLASTRNPLLVSMDQDYEIRAHFLSTLDVLYVDDNAPGDPKPGDPSVSDPCENGSPGHPFDRIQEAIEVTPEGASIIVRPGTYHENIDLLGKRIRVTGIDPNDTRGAAFPVIAGADMGPVVRFAAGEDPNCVVMGFVVTRGDSRSSEAIVCAGSSPTLANCLVVGNRSADPNGAAIACTGSRAAFTSCTIADNDGGLQGAALSLADSNVVVVDCIVWGNTPQPILLSGTSRPSVTYTDVAGGWEGEGNIDADPLFVQSGHWADPNDPARALEPTDPCAVWVAGDYHLRSQAGRWEPSDQTWLLDDVTSPCIDLGQSAGPGGQELYPSGGTLNLGAYGGTVQASRSYSSSSSP